MVNNATIGALRVSLGLDSAQFQTGLKRSEKQLDGFGRATQKSLVLVKNFGAGLVAGLAAGGIAGIVNQIGQIANSIATVGDEAKRAGLSIKAFQELKYVAEQNRLGVDSLVDGIKEMQLRIDEFAVTGKGSAAEAFMRLGYTADELTRKLADPTELFSEIIGKLGQLDRAAQIRIADEIFGGTGGEKFVQLIDQGEKGIRDTIKQAHRLGIVMNDDLVKKADELDRKFQQVTTTVGTALKTAIVEAASALSGFINEFERLDQSYQKRLSAADAGAMLGGMVLPEGVTRSTSTRSRATELDARMAGTLATELSKADQELIDALKQRYADGANKAIVPIVPPPPGNDNSGDSGNSMLEREREMQESRLQMLQTSLLTEQEYERNAYANRLLELQDFLDSKIITQQEFDQLDAQLRQQHADNMVEIARDQAEREKAVRYMALDAAAGALSAMSSLLESEGGKQLKISKAFGVAAAAVSTAVGISKAMELPFPANWAQAAAVAATGAAQIAAINRTTRGGGYVSPSLSSGAGGESSGRGDSNTQAISISLQGDYFSKQSVEELIAQFNDAISDGHKLIVRTT